MLRCVQSLSQVRPKSTYDVPESASLLYGVSWLTFIFVFLVVMQNEAHDSSSMHLFATHFCLHAGTEGINSFWVWLCMYVCMYVVIGKNRRQTFSAGSNSRQCSTCLPHTTLPLQGTHTCLYCVYIYMLHYVMFMCELRLIWWCSEGNYCLRCYTLLTYCMYVVVGECVCCWCWKSIQFGLKIADMCFM